MVHAATFRKIYNIAAPFPKTDYYEPFRVPTPTIHLFVEKNEALHGKFKRQFSHVYSASGVKDLDSNIDASIEKFIAEIQKTEGTNIDLGKWFERLMLDCICDLTFGKNQGFIDKCNLEGLEDDPFAELGRLIRQAHLHGMTPLLFYVAKMSTFVTEKIFPRKSIPDVTGRTVEALLADFKDPSNAENFETQRSIASKLHQVQSSKGSGTFKDEDVEYLVDFGVKASVLDALSK
ncbi:hypothetical protein NW752_000375 [Fusarium irregulare]|nr:hypothetical protein NW752_000375 [Fusarium irregulare]